MDPKYLEIFNCLLTIALSLSVHEAAHAFVAKLQGDTTAEKEGRLTLNPIAHIDIIGTIILPLTMMIFSGAMFGWAKPVPVDLRNLKNQRWGYMYVALAGPFSNIILCTLSIVIIVIYSSSTGVPEPGDPLMAFAVPMIQINALLAILNMIPIPPLDGSTVLDALLPKKLRKLYQEYITPYGMFILLALLLSNNLGFVIELSDRYIETLFKALSSVVT